METIKKHRDFIHSISNAISVAEGGILTAIDEIYEKCGDELKEEVKSLQKTEEYLKKIIHEIKEYRIFIHELEQKAQEKESG